MSDEDEVKDLPFDETGEHEEQDAGQGQKAEGTDRAASSTEQDELKADDDMLSVARKVIDDKLAKPNEAASSADSQDAGDKPASQTRKERDNEEYSDVPFSKHPRFRELITERNGLREDAGRYRNVENFIQNAGLDAASAAEALSIAGLMRTDPQRAWRELQPTLQKLLVAAGEALPPELQGRVAKGELQLEAAVEISRARASEQALRARDEFFRHRDAAERQRQSTTALAEAATAWETERQQRDPNFAEKLPLLEREVLWLTRAEGVPQSTDGVRDQLKRAYEAVNKSFRPTQQSAPRRAPTRPVMGGVPGSGGDAKRPINGSTLDIVRSIVERRAS